MIGVYKAMLTTRLIQLQMERRELINQGHMCLQGMGYFKEDRVVEAMKKGYHITQEKLQRLYGRMGALEIVLDDNLDTKSIQRLIRERKKRDNSKSLEKEGYIGELERILGEVEQWTNISKH